ncbi:FAD-binding oxidoreductase [Streptomyces iconiensis]|uniref:FAD-binding oxidoreductase n=1 Tax=Streptomyces iconiensis TaxID=1384038 RepID=A0ABT6ZRC7_9ACTN|nr:FAD-binding oxidoreductase [Streptomyces iconiensis]MDJ1131412.1 FAD-binding oxidoreductase [Streptomyces iconiensis]
MSGQPAEPSDRRSQDALRAALRDWRQAIGAEHIHTDRSSLERFGTATYPTHREIAAVILPADQEQLRDCLRIASRHRVPLYPVSTGKNWGYGSATPPAGDCVLMPLSRLNRILDYDDELAHVTVEPGVTQRQLHAFLAEKGGRHLAGFTGSTPDSSLVGNVLERGLGHGRYGDRCAHVCAFEAVLATGETLRTGFSRYPGAVTGPLHRWGVGPWLDGLFTQSNLGVVTRMTLWLTPVPGHFDTFRFTLGDDRSTLDRVLDAVRRLRMAGVLDAGFVIANDVRAIAARQRYPWGEAGDRTPLSPDLRRRLRHRWGVGAWNGDGVLHAVDDRHGAELRRIVTEALGPHVERLSFEGDSDLGGEGGSAAAAYCAPSETGLAMAYWRLRDTPGHAALPRLPPGGADLDRDGCGLIWVCPVVPLNGRHVAAAVDAVERVTQAHGFEANIGLNSVSERAVVATTALAYDRSVPGEDARAMRCDDELERQLNELGYPPYRMSTRSMEAPPLGDDDLPAVLGRLKHAMDPAGVLAPGRYEFRRAPRPGSACSDST